MKTLVTTLNRPPLRWVNSFFYFCSVLVVLFLTFVAAYYEEVSALFLVSRTTLYWLMSVPIFYLLTESVIFFGEKKCKRPQILGIIIGILSLIDVIANILLENLMAAGNFFVIMIIMILVTQKFYVKNFN